VRGDYVASSLAFLLLAGPSPRAWGLRASRVRSSLASGPSPRAWGLRSSQARRREPRRAIPTCVGTTAGLEAPPPAPAGHPHVRGDYGIAHAPGQKPAGPSPRVWGLLANQDGRHVHHRAIPTCVGTTAPPRPGGRAAPGHPHVCGDYWTLFSPWASLSGHPHVCGDYPPTSTDDSVMGGPSPRVWGLHQLVPIALRDPGAIPTCVGNTTPFPTRA